jgi:hypothetical protein
MIKFDISALIKLFPKNPVARPRNYPYKAHTGWIPMDFFEDFESEIRATMRKHSMKVTYRGPRPQGKNPLTTQRRNATHAVLYR